jgi:hypothetical protein
MAENKGFLAILPPRGTEMAACARASEASAGANTRDAWARLEFYFKTGSLDLL